MSQWIWKFGEFEIYHNVLRHSQRQHYGYVRPPMWKIYRPDPVVRFRKKVSTEGGWVHVRKCGDMFTTLQMEGAAEKIELDGQTDFYLPAGAVTITFLLNNTTTFPCVYVSGVVESDESWIADDNTSDWEKCGTNPLFGDPDHTPEVFPFVYEKIAPVKKEKTENGVLFDFGKEVFGPVRISGLNWNGQKVQVRYGESREEAMDAAWAVIRFNDIPENGELRYIPYAFRYIFVGEPAAEIEAESEMFPLERKASFSSNHAELNHIWETAAYTFHLNSREFILDGIKRDGWVWAADAYQSFFVNRYLFADQDLEKRTLIALAGKSPVKQHINTIMDYTFFWMISMWDYYMTYGDLEFLRRMSDRMRELMEFCLHRTDADGFIRGRKGDWVFIDWAVMDREGALCGEQILYAKAMECYGKICDMLGEDDLGCAKKAKDLFAAVNTWFYDAEKGVFVDSYESGKRFVTRHSNLLAYLYLPCSTAIKKQIYERVVLNDEVEPITTPYFKFYENQVHCMEGKISEMEASLEAYYGKMLETGATTLYEAFDPTLEGIRHYEMYGHPFEKSLCHAWSASPIYLLGRFVLGVQSTSAAGKTFEVKPEMGSLTEIDGTVPIGKGCVRMHLERECIRICTDVPGGTLIWRGERIELEPGHTYFFE